MYTVQTEQDFTIIHIKLNDIHVSLMDYGATIVDVKTKDKQENLESVVLKYDNPTDYLDNLMYLNTTIGPLSGRTKDATFTLNGDTYQLDKNDGENNLHIGKNGLSFKRFYYKIVEEEDETSVIFTYNSTDQDSLFPGNQIYKVVYKVRNSQITIEYIVETDTDTLINLTNHTYFNLSGKTNSDILNHQVKIDSSSYLETDEGFVPFKKTQMDSSINLRTLDYVKNYLTKPNYKEGINHQFLIDTPPLVIPGAILYDEESQRMLEVYTTYPVIVCYTHNYPGKELLLESTKQRKHMGICFEAQYESNGINIEEFNSSILKKNERYEETIIFKFSIKQND